MSGDITPVKPKKYPNFFVLLGGLLTVLFLACCVISWMARPPADKNAAVPASVPTATLPPSYRILRLRG